MAYKYSDNFTVTDAGTYEPKCPSQAIRGQVVGFSASITATPVTGDVWRFIKVPKGAKLLSCRHTNTDMGTDVPGTLGWESADNNAFDTDVDWEDAATADIGSAEMDAATTPTTEDYLSVTIGTVSSGASGTATVTGAWFVP